MNLFGIGPLEILVVLTIALLVFGPEDLVAFARRLGAWLRKIRRTEAWHTITRTSYELEHWQQRLWKETGLADIAPTESALSAWHPTPPYTTWQHPYAGHSPHTEDASPATHDDAPPA